jgi:polar amino acid transport system substrate-binding protein
MVNRTLHGQGARAWGGVGLALLLLAGGTVRTRAADELRVLTEFDWPPFEYLDKSGAPAGFDIDLANAVCKVLERPCKFIETPFDDIIPALAAGKGDVIVDSLTITEERKQKVAFTIPYLRSQMRFVAKRGYSGPTTPEGLKGVKIGVEVGTVQEAYARKTFPGAELVLNDNPDVLNRMFDRLAKGDFDLLLVNALVAWNFMSPVAGTSSPEAGKAFTFAGDPIYTDQAVGMAVRKDDDALRQKINAALVQIRTDGTYKKINAKYFPFSLDAGS